MHFSVTMISITLLTVTFTVFLVKAESNIYKTCRDIPDCCGVKINVANLDQIQPCLDLPEKTSNCDRSLCVAEKKGIPVVNGKVDKKALKEAIENDFKSEPQLVKKMVQKCIEKNVDKYGTPDEYCEMVNYMTCIKVQMIKLCPEWDFSHGVCEDMKQSVEECKSLED